MRGVLVTRDNGFEVFKRRRERERIAAQNVSLEIKIGELKQIRKDMIELLEGKEAWRKRDADLAKVILWEGEGRAGLEKVIQNNIQYPPDFQYDVVISNIISEDIGAIVTTAHESMRDGGQADITLHFRFDHARRPSGMRRNLYGCGVARDDDAGEVRTQWVKPKTSPSSSLSIPR